MKMLVIQIAGLGYDFATDNGLAKVEDIAARKFNTVFPALTSPVQAALRTGLSPSYNGVIANGFLDRRLRKTFFWEQSSALVEGERIWQRFRERGGTVGMTFFQQSLGENADQIISPAPVHTHGGGLITACGSRPESLYAALCRFAGGPFKLHRYWGPLASPSASRWIARAMAGLIASADAPDLLMTYLPCLDYDLQRFGTQHARCRKAAAELRQELSLLFRTARDNGYEIAAFGDYAITDVTGGAVFPNKALRKAGLLKTRRIRKMLYPDMHQSIAFAVVDHQIAAINCFDTAAMARVAELLSSLEGVDQVMAAEQQKEAGVEHPRGPELLLTAKPGYWFAYPWWNHGEEAPDYANHVDIHNKPGYDPCELFFGRNPFRTSLDEDRIKGSHGLNGPGCETALYTTLDAPPPSLLALALQLKKHLT